MWMYGETDVTNACSKLDGSKVTKAKEYCQTLGAPPVKGETPRAPSVNASTSVPPKKIVAKKPLVSNAPTPSGSNSEPTSPRPEQPKKVLVQMFLIELEHQHVLSI